MNTLVPEIIPEALLIDNDRRQIGSMFPLHWRIRYRGAGERGWVKREPDLRAVVREDGMILGQVAVAKLTLACGPDIEVFGIGDLVTKHFAREQGIAKILLSSATEQCKSMGANLILSASRSKAVISIFDDLGFESATGSGLYYLKNGKAEHNKSWILKGQAPINPLEIRGDF
jgi:predicted N-acetyltransferase YhbS